MTGARAVPGFIFYSPAHSMHDADLFFTTAQIGMALAGFAGLLTLLGHTRDAANARLNEVSFRSMMELSLTLAIFALLPFVPQELGVEPVGAFRIASAIYAGSMVVFLARSARRNRALMGRTMVQGVVSIALYVVGVLTGALLAVNALVHLETVAQGLYFAALFLHFGGATFFFARLLYGSLAPIPAVDRSPGVEPRDP